MQARKNVVLQNRPYYIASIVLKCRTKRGVRDLVKSAIIRHKNGDIFLKRKIGINVSIRQEQFRELGQILIALQQLSEILAFVLSECSASQCSDSDQSECKAHGDGLSCEKGI